MPRRPPLEAREVPARAQEHVAAARHGLAEHSLRLPQLVGHTLARRVLGPEPSAHSLGPSAVTPLSLIPPSPRPRPPRFARSPRPSPRTPTGFPGARQPAT